MNKTVYIHYGASEFDKNVFEPIKNRYRESKPFGGLWASPVNSKFGWKKWCEDAKFRLDDLDTSFSFMLPDDARVLHLRSGKDVDELPRCNWKCFSGDPGFMYIDFEKLMEKYDAIEVHISEDRECDEYWDTLYFKMWGWDCDSILIMNPDIIVPISVEKEESK